MMHFSTFVLGPDQAGSVCVSPILLEIPESTVRERGGRWNK